MKTVDKALALLTFFGVSTPELGLSEISRLAAVDKATTLRLLNSLKRHGFVEQDAVSRKYRLGSAVLRFARVREATFPMVSVVQPVLERLATETGETAHGSLAVQTGLISIGSAAPPRMSRVFIDPSQEYPFHATASGIAYLAFAPPEVVDRVLQSGQFAPLTEHTPISGEDIRTRIEATRKRGYSLAIRTFEREVASIGVPIFDWSGHASGSIAIACVASRWGDDSEESLAPQAVTAAVSITRALGAEPSRGFLDVAGRLVERSAPSR